MDRQARRAGNTRAQPAVSEVALARISRLDPADPDWMRVASGLFLTVTEALLQGYSETLAALIDPLRLAAADAGDTALGGFLQAMHGIVFEAAQRLPDDYEHGLVADEPSGAFMRALASMPREEQEMRQTLGLEAEAFAKVGRRLLGSGLVVQRRAGRHAMWELSPRGEQVMPFAEVARTFLASIATASSQGTKEQTDWMIATAREGLRRAGGPDLDLEGRSS